MPDDDKRYDDRRDERIHRPAPYVVKLRVAASDDVAGVDVEYRGYGYTITEAVLSAIWAEGFKGFDDPKIQIVSVEPDLAQYAADIVNRVEVQRTSMTKTTLRSRP